MFRIQIFFLFSTLYLLLNFLRIQGLNVAEEIVDSENGTHIVTNSSADDKTVANGSQTMRSEDEPWVNEAIRDVAYYLRSYKFTEWDRRYHPKGGPPEMFGGYPRPPLRMLHWEVKANCDGDDFLECLRYLHRVTKKTPRRREDDSIYFVLQTPGITRNATFSANAECLKTLKSETKTGDPFMGPIERLQWRTTASVYMCRFTLMRRPALETFGEPCDNHGACLDPANGYNPRNRDPRANDGVGFACAEYSFCPHPCCPLQLIKDIQECNVSTENPCHSENQGPNGNPTCTMNKEDNMNLIHMVLNYWNVSCNCGDRPGFVWRPQYGICVDIDECLKEDVCEHSDVELCVNHVGNYTCICRWGYERDADGMCVESEGVKMLDHDYLDRMNRQGNVGAYLKSAFKKMLSTDNSESSSDKCILTFYNLLVIVLVNILIRL